MDCWILKISIASVSVRSRLLGILAFAILNGSAATSFAIQKTEKSEPIKVIFEEDSTKEKAKANPNDVDEEALADLETTIDEILEGHSIHGEAFNEGPRQRAYLMGGTGNVQFPVTTESKEAQAFINQGVGQLH